MSRTSSPAPDYDPATTAPTPALLRQDATAATPTTAGATVEPWQIIVILLLLILVVVPIVIVATVRAARRK